jgi:hypothetical protein
MERNMERKKLLRIGVRLTGAIIEILKDEFSEKKVRRTNENGQKKIKAGSKRTRKNSAGSYGFSAD